MQNDVPNINYSNLQAISEKNIFHYVHYKKIVNPVQ